MFTSCFGVFRINWTFILESSHKTGGKISKEIQLCSCIFTGTMVAGPYSGCILSSLYTILYNTTYNIYKNVGKNPGYYPQNSTEYREIPWNSMEYHCIPRNTIVLRRIPLEFQRKQWEYHGIPWNSCI